jgi:hypothetical protein
MLAAMPGEVALVAVPGEVVEGGMSLGDGVSLGEPLHPYPPRVIAIHFPDRLGLPGS